MCVSGYAVLVRGVQSETKWIITTVCDPSQHVWTKQSLFLRVPYLGYSYCYLTNGPYTGAQSSYTSAAARWTNTHKEHISHTLMALDLIFLLLSICSERHNTLKKKKRGKTDPFSLMKWKACVAAICQSRQRFTGGSDYWGIFSLCSFSNYMVRREEYKERNGLIADSWGTQRKIDYILKERLRNRLRPWE